MANRMRSWARSQWHLSSPEGEEQYPGRLQKWVSMRLSHAYVPVRVEFMEFPSGEFDRQGRSQCIAIVGGARMQRFSALNLGSVVGLSLTLGTISKQNGDQHGVAGTHYGNSAHPLLARCSIKSGGGGRDLRRNEILE